MNYKETKLIFLGIIFLGTFGFGENSLASCSGSGLAWNCSAGSTISQINSAISSASDGAVITCQNGSYSWSGGLAFSISKGVTLKCESVGGCAVSASSLWQWANWGTSSKLYRISGFKFTGVGSYFIWLYGTGSSTATLTQLRFDHNELICSNNCSDVITFGEVSGVKTTISGVIDNNIFRTTSGNSRWIVNYCQTSAIWPSGRIGTADNLFVEDNQFIDQCTTNAGNAALDTDGGPLSWVIRHNSFTNARIEHHGYYWSFPGPANSEVYDNTFKWTCGSQTLDGSYSIKHQGSGEWIVFNNTVTPGRGKGSAHILQNYRSFYDSGNQCNGTDAEDGNRVPIATHRGYPCNRQPGRDANLGLKPQYYWNNKWNDNTVVNMTLSCPDQGIPNYCNSHIQANRDYYQGGAIIQTSPTSPFDGTTGMGFGTLANRPTTCTTTSELVDAGHGGVGYFATNVGSQGTLYMCSAANTWTAYYQPYVYPHPLRNESGGDTTAPKAPGGLSVR